MFEGKKLKPPEAAATLSRRIAEFFQSKGQVTPPQAAVLEPHTRPWVPATQLLPARGEGHCSHKALKFSARMARSCHFGPSDTDTRFPGCHPVE